MAAAEPQEALDALLRASASGALESVSFDADSVQFADGGRFPRDTMLTAGVDQPYRLDVLCFYAQFASRNPGVVNPVAYVKEARSAGVVTVAFADRARVLAYLATAETEGAPNAKRPRRAAAAGAAHPADRGFDDFLPVPQDLRLRDCAQLNDRNSILLSRTKSLSGVLEILHNAMKSGSDARHKDAKAPVAPPPALKSSRYKEVQEQRFWQERLGTRDVDELGIDTNASFLADAVQPLPPGLAPPAAPQAKQPAAPQPAPKSAAPAAAPGRASGFKDKAGGIPIIIVPSGLGSQVLLNMFNAKPFFEDCAFVPWEQQKAAGVQKEAVLEIKRRCGRAKPVVYHVIDKPPPKKSSEWARVVAVFVQGAMWQFRDFPFKGAAEGNLLSTFEHVQAFFVRYDSEPLPDFVKKWSVSTLALSKNARHSDRSIVEGFWQALDHSLQMKRSTLQF